MPTGFGVNSSPFTTFVASRFSYAFSEYRAISAFASAVTASGALTAADHNGRQAEQS